MKQRRFIFSILLLLACLGLFTQAVWDTDEQPTSDEEAINLALREIAHELLLQSGDSTTTIPPVQQLAGGKFSLQWQQDVDYSQLKMQTDQTFATYGITQPYRLSLYDCQSNELMLGFFSETQSQSQPCAKRQAETFCYNMTFTFPALAQSTPPSTPLHWSMSLLFLLLGVVGTRFISKDKSEKNTPVANHFTITADAVVIDGKTHSLTYQEARLLQYFDEHANTPLSRTAILAAVWEDDAGKITRTLDVFVSRLRKILQECPDVQIATVHGLGYRFDKKI